jgi:TonB family protein
VTPETRGKLFTLATVVHRVNPKYPSDARKARIEGSVLFCVTIGKDGAVRSVHVISGPNELSLAAVNALERWRFRPFLANGEPAEGSVRVRVNFFLVNGISVTVA